MNGNDREEIRAILHQVHAYPGVPAKVECFRIARSPSSDAVVA